MSCCESNTQFISLYFFQNGSCCKPEKVRVRKNEIDKTISKEGKFCYYRDKCIYSLNGDCINSIKCLADNCAYVLVMPMESFKPLNYSETFSKFMKTQAARRSMVDQNRSCQKNNNTNYRKCQSTPVIPISCRKCSEPSVKFVPCEKDDDSDEECPCDRYKDDECQLSSSRRKKSVAPQPPQQPINVKKKGFIANCCACCVKPQPSQAPSKPMIECGNGKMTQTTMEDFKCAMARMKRIKAEEKKRAKMYKRAAARRRDRSGNSEARPLYCPREEGDDPDECENPKDLRKLESERTKFMDKRLAMEKRIRKVLDQKYAKLLKHGEC